MSRTRIKKKAPKPQRRELRLDDLQAIVERTKAILSTRIHKYEDV